MRRLVLTMVAAALLGGGATVAAAGQGQGPEPAVPVRVELGRAHNGHHGSLAFRSGRETVTTRTVLPPGAGSGWHRHPGALVVLVTSGVLTTYGLDGSPCRGRDVPAGTVLFEADAAGARWPHFVRNRGTVPTEIVWTAFDVPSAQPARSDSRPPRRCADPTR